MEKKKNIIFIMCDQMQGAVLNKNSDFIVPNIQALAKDAVTVSRAYAPNPICSPSRASLMTGTLPHIHGMVDVTHAVPSYRAEYNYELDTFSSVLKRSGYACSYYGKWHVERSHELEQFGYDEYITERDIPHPNFTFSKKTILSNNRPGYTDKTIGGVFKEGIEETDEHFLFSKAIDFIEKQKDGPFFTFISTNAPHDPYVVPEKFFNLYQKMDLPESFNDNLEDKPVIYKRIKSVLSSLTEEDFKNIRRYYHAYCSVIDEEVGRLIRYLKNNNLYDETLIVFLSDHGDLQGAHGLFFKGVPAFEEGYRIPLLFKLPNNHNKGTTTNDIFSICDVAPTVLKILELNNLKTQINGLDKSSSLYGETHDYIAYAENFGQRYAYTQRIIWKGSMKYIFNAFDFDELYDLEKDPYEMHNVINDPLYADSINDLCSEMQKIVALTKDTTLGDATYYMHRFLPVGPLKEAGTSEYTIYNKEF